MTLRELAILLALTLASAACGRSSNDAAVRGARPGPKADCPAGYASDPVRSAKVRRALAQDSEAAFLLRRSEGRFRICFAPGAAGVLASDTFLLDAAHDDARLVGRGAHLLHHLVTGRGQRTSGDPNDPAEQDAFALERRVTDRYRKGQPD